MANRQVFQLTAKTTSSINSTDVIPVQSLGHISASKVSVQSLQDFMLQRTVTSASLHATSSATTASLVSGVNIVYTSSFSNFCTKLPAATTGSVITVINSSNYKAQVFPQTGGRINNGTNAPFVVPADGLAYTFTCYAVSASSTVGYWSTDKSQNSNSKTLRFPTIWVPHTSGSGTGVDFYGVGYQNITGSASGSGLAWTGSVVSGSFNAQFNTVLYPTSSLGGGRQLVWRSETVPTTATKLRVYTNISGSDMVGEGKINFSLIRTYATDATTRVNAETTSTFFWNTGSPDNSSTFRMNTQGITKSSSSFTPIRVGEAGTLWAEVALPADTQIGGQTTNYGPYYYTFDVEIQSPIKTKNYLFNVEIDYI
jgi:hypothetical protein